MEKKHTPGPWRLNDSLHEHVLSDNYHVVDAGRGFHKDGQFGKGFSVAAFMSISDARLIAAAPELLEALESIRQYANDTLSGRADGGPDDRAWQRECVIECRNRARDAIAKATGR